MSLRLLHSWSARDFGKTSKKFLLVDFVSLSLCSEKGEEEGTQYGGHKGVIGEGLARRKFKHVQTHRREEEEVRVSPRTFSRSLAGVSRGTTIVTYIYLETDGRTTTSY